jgi:hypothetical protein
MANQEGVFRIYANQMFFSIERNYGLLYALQSKRWTRKLEQSFHSTTINTAETIKLYETDPKVRDTIAQMVLASLDRYL